MNKFRLSFLLQAVSGSHLLKTPFKTIFEYLQILRSTAMTMRDLGSHAVYYLAAAVSDFYVPWKSMAEHKLQSASAPLDMRLGQVPKMLSALKKAWDPMAFCISFKIQRLVKDSKILLEKAEMALKKYRMHMVVANELSTCKEEVTVVTGNEKILVSHDKTQSDSDMEEPLIELTVGRHSAYVKDSDL